MCDRASESCPVFPGKARRLHVGFDDPPRLAATAASQEVRDQIRVFIETLPAGLAVSEVERLGS